MSKGTSKAVGRHCIIYLVERNSKRKRDWKLITHFQISTTDDEYCQHRGLKGEESGNLRTGSPKRSYGSDTKNGH
jgi:hypothetical protein